MICISIPYSDIETCLSLISKADMAEIRIDMAQFDESAVREIFRKSSKPLIATCRPDLVDDYSRAQLLKTAIESGAAYVDIEIESSEDFKQDIITCAKTHNCKVIISYHNYENTPFIHELQTIVDSCFSSGADIAKIATTANTTEDSARILGLYSQYSSLVALAMGELGKITRITNIYLGSPFTFASVNNESKTAPGQFSIEEMQRIILNISE